MPTINYFPDNVTTDRLPVTVSDDKPSLPTRGVGLRAEDLPFSLGVPWLERVLAIPVRQVYELLERGKIPGARKLGAQWRVNRDVLLSWLAGNSAPR